MSWVPSRPFFAALLSILQPGIGHLYLKAWIRTTVWAGLWLVFFSLAVHNAPSELGYNDLLVAMVGVLGTIEYFSVEYAAVLVVITLVATVDSYWLGTQQSQHNNSEHRCPVCGREQDLSLEFCHWCTSFHSEIDSN